MISRPKEAIWVYDLEPQMPKWDKHKQDYIPNKKTKRLDPREAKRLIKENNLKCIHSCDDGKIYA